MTTEAERLYQRDWMRRHRAAHPATAEQLAERAAKRRDRRKNLPDHEAALARARRAVDPERHRQRERRRWADPARRSTKQAYARANAYRESWREARFRDKYGLALADYEAMLVAQGGRCAICKRPETAMGSGGRIKRLAVDHDHATGVVRSLLCQRCNMVLRAIGDDPEILAAVVRYLTASPTLPPTDVAP